MKKFTSTVKLALIAPVISMILACRVIKNDIPEMWRSHKIGVIVLIALAPIVTVLQLMWIAILPVICLVSERVRQSVLIARAAMMQPAVA